MTPDALRTVLKQWLETQIRIDEWGLNNPESVKDASPPSSALDQAVSKYAIEQQLGFATASNFVVAATLPFRVIYRFDKGYKYTQIPRGIAESVLVKILTTIKSCPCIAPDILEVDPTGSVVLNEITKGDWLLIFELEFAVKFTCEFLEFSNLDKGVFQ